MDVPARLRLAIGVRHRCSTVAKGGSLRIRRRRRNTAFRQSLHPPHEHPRHDASRPPRASSSYSISCPATVRAGTEHYMPPELYRYVRWVRGRPRLRVHYAPAPDYARGRTEQTVTPEFIESHSLSDPKNRLYLYCLAAARKDRTAGGDRPRTRRILPAVAQRKSDSGGHRTRKTRILPHAGLLAQLDEPHEKIHLLQRRDRTEPARH